MQNLTGVVELNQNEMMDVDGGLLPIPILIGAAIVIILLTPSTAN